VIWFTSVERLEHLWRACAVPGQEALGIEERSIMQCCECFIPFGVDQHITPLEFNESVRVTHDGAKLYHVWADAMQDCSNGP